MSWYNSIPKGSEKPNSWYIQRERCYNRIIENKKCPTHKCIEKYGIEFNDRDEILIPPDLKRPALKVKTAIKPMKSAQESIEYLVGTYKPNGLPPKQDSIKKYKQITSIIKLAGGDTENIKPTLEDYDKLLEALKEKYPNKETLKQKWQVVLTHVSHVPLDLSEETILKYKNIFNELKEESNREVSEKKKIEKVYRWDKILEGIENTFGTNSLENFFFRMFDEIPIRSEFTHEIPIVHQLDEAPEEGNFVMDGGGHMINFHLREWKTKGSKYPAEIIYKFSPELCDIFRRTQQPRSVLLPVPNWGKWIKESLDKAGFLKFPHGVEDTRLSDMASGLRRTIATFRNSVFNTTKPKGLDLSRLMLHAHNTSETVYRHDHFI